MPLDAFELNLAISVVETFINFGCCNCFIVLRPFGITTNLGRFSSQIVLCIRLDACVMQLLIFSVQTHHALYNPEIQRGLHQTTVGWTW